MKNKSSTQYVETHFRSKTMPNEHSKEQESTEDITEAGIILKYARLHQPVKFMDEQYDDERRSSFA